MRTSTRIAVVLALVSALFAAGFAGASADQEPQVTICHRTNSNKNPYVQITVDQSAVDGESGGDHYAQHTGPLWDATLKAAKTKWGDVIPPVSGHHSGSQAWTALGADAADFISGGCVFEEQVDTYDVTLDKVTTGGTAPAASTDFSFDVLCEPDDVADAVVISPEDAPLLVGNDIALDDFCTITETGSNGATDISYQVTGGTVDSATDDSVTFSIDGAVTVVATNTFPEPTGDVTLDKALTGASAPAESTPHEFSVACGSGTAPSPVNVSPNQGAVLVADDVAQGDQCTITETGDFTDHEVAYQVTGGTDVTPGINAVTFTVGNTAVSVVATNDYPSVAGVVIVPTPAPVELPRTGSMTAYSAMAGVALLLAGFGLRGAGRRLEVNTER